MVKLRSLHSTYTKQATQEMELLVAPNQEESQQYQSQRESLRKCTQTWDQVKSDTQSDLKTARAEKQ